MNDEGLLSIVLFQDEIETKQDLDNFAENNYEELSTLKGRRENLWKKYHRAKTEKQKPEIFAEINSIQPTIKELCTYAKILKIDQNLYKIILTILIKISKKKKTILGYYKPKLSFFHFIFFFYIHKDCDLVHKN